MVFPGCFRVNFGNTAGDIAVRVAGLHLLSIAPLTWASLKLGKTVPVFVGVALGVGWDSTWRGGTMC